MIRHSQGNQAKTTVRCPYCAFENIPDPGNEGRLVALSCMRCGSTIVTDRKAWDHWGWVAYVGEPKW